MSKVLKWIFIIVLLIGLAGCYTVYMLALKPNVNLHANEEGFLYIKTGSTYADVIQQLNSQHLLKSTKTFDWLARFKKYDNKVKPGRYAFNSKQNNQDIINMLRSGNQSPVKLAFNNIRTKQQLAGIVSQKIEADSTKLLQLLNDSAFISLQGFNRYNIMALFIPNTYEFYWNTSADKFISRMHKEYDSFWNPMRMQQAANAGLKPVDVITLASIVQEETQMPADRPVIAGVYINRIKKNMPLEADPTLKFALNNFAIKRLLNEDKKVESPYNTYKYAGLPPGPINLPAIPYIDAVLNYTKHNYLFFCAREDLSGYSNFAQTYAQHLVNARKYQAELNRRNIKR
ncbi:MAG: endolytic transglycosylase MltG [Bacteroidia bacterium]|nr:endolytic transglycosylase MltG [Bacteroidia bacterium]